MSTATDSIRANTNARQQQQRSHGRSTSVAARDIFNNQLLLPTSAGAGSAAAAKHNIWISETSHVNVDSAEGYGSTTNSTTRTENHGPYSFQSRSRSRSGTLNSRLKYLWPMLVLSLLDLSYTIHSLIKGDRSLLFINLVRSGLLGSIGSSKRWRERALIPGSMLGITIGSAVWQVCGLTLQNRSEEVNKRSLINSCTLAAVEYLTYLLFIRLSPPLNPKPHPSLRLPNPGTSRGLSHSHSRSRSSVGISPISQRARAGHSRAVSRGTLRSIKSSRTYKSVQSVIDHQCEDQDHDSQLGQWPRDDPLQGLSGSAADSSTQPGAYLHPLQDKSNNTRQGHDNYEAEVYELDTDGEHDDYEREYNGSSDEMSNGSEGEEGYDPSDPFTVNIDEDEDEDDTVLREDEDDEEEEEEEDDDDISSISESSIIDIPLPKSPSTLALDIPIPISLSRRSSIRLFSHSHSHRHLDGDDDNEGEGEGGMRRRSISMFGFGKSWESAKSLLSPNRNRSSVGAGATPRRNVKGISTIETESPSASSNVTGRREEELDLPRYQSQYQISNRSHSQGLPSNKNRNRIREGNSADAGEHADDYGTFAPYTT